MDHAASGLSQIAVTVSNVESALRFYRDVLGLKFLFAAGPNLAFLDVGGVRLMLTTPQGVGAVGANSILYFDVGDIDAAYSAMVARGARGERAPALTAKLPNGELWSAFLRDPDDNLVGLQSMRAS